MSDILDRIEFNNAIALKEELEKTTYGKPLAEKFEELGVGEVWKAGKSKASLIALAMQRIENNKLKPKVEKTDLQEAIEEEENEKALVENSILDEEIVKESIEEPVKEEHKDEEIPNVKDEPVLNESETKIEEAPKHTTELNASVISLEDLKKNLINIRCNIKQAPDFLKAILYAKESQIMEKISKYED